MPIEHSFLASQPLFGLVTHGVKCCVGKLMKDTHLQLLPVEVMPAWPDATTIAVTNYLL